METTAFGLYESNLVAAFRGDHLLKIRAQQIIVATGGRQQPFLFHNNDLPGIMLASGALRLARQYGVAPGRRAVVVTDNDAGQQLAGQLEQLGVEIVAVIDRRSALEDVHPPRRWPTLQGHVVLRAYGGHRLKGVQVAALDPLGRAENSTGQTFACDLLCLASQMAPANELLLHAGVRFQFANGRWLPTRQGGGLWAAGAGAGTMDLVQQIAEGRLRGAEAAAAVGCATPDLETARQRWQAAQNALLGVPSCTLHPQQRSDDRKRFVCLCEDVTEKDLHQAIAEGFDGIETLKRYSTVNMGPCQGKVCGHLAVEICARTTGRNIAAVGTTTSRPPVVPVELGVLAAAQHHPVRRTPLHAWHEAHGARWMDAGQWKRPESYGDSVAEVRAVRDTVGCIDVSTLGKIEVIGPDASELLERIYLNRWKDLRPGRVRYGVICNEDGILFDDGVGTLLGPNRYYLTATTGNAEAVYQWLELWRVTWRLDVTVLNQTSSFAAMNVAGPVARTLVSRLTDLDLSAKAFPYLTMRAGPVAGVPCRLLRIGFVGEVGYEIHCPSAQALWLWEALEQAGKDLGLRPFGVEAQRILRLEKGHLIIGQDTDALSHPLEAGLEGLVHFDKPLFHGRPALLRLKERGPRMRLVGFRMLDTERVLPEGSQVVEEGRPVGRLTSTRYSPTLGCSVGLAWVPINRAAIGCRFQVRCNGIDEAALVVPLPFYDPDGKRLRG
jgi:sarcosine oxidase subunit alpha